jgi:hypothetical protein
MTLYNPKPSKLNKIIADAVFGLILFFFAFLFFVMVLPAVVDQI